MHNWLWSQNKPQLLNCFDHSQGSELANWFVKIISPKWSSTNHLTWLHYYRGSQFDKLHREQWYACFGGMQNYDIFHSNILTFISMHGPFDYFFNARWSKGQCENREISEWACFMWVIWPMTVVCVHIGRNSKNPPGPYFDVDFHWLHIAVALHAIFLIVVVVFGGRKLSISRRSLTARCFICWLN